MSETPHHLPANFGDFCPFLPPMAIVPPPADRDRSPLRLLFHAACMLVIVIVWSGWTEFDWPMAGPAISNPSSGPKTPDSLRSMSSNPRIAAAIRGALVADAYSLGAHWVYDKELLKTMNINWNGLNDPQSPWQANTGKKKGDFTHYGDQLMWLRDYIAVSKAFDVAAYRDVWKGKMATYTGYKDGASKETLQILEKDPAATIGASSHDFSVVGRIVPLLSVASSQAEFLSMTQQLVAFTHNDAHVLAAAEYFATVLYKVAIDGAEVAETVKNTPVQDDDLSASLKKAVEGGSMDTLTAIQTFGQPCGVGPAFPGAIHMLLHCNGDYRTAMMASAKAGGDSAARSMAVGMILAAAGSSIPSEWENDVKNM